MPRDNQFDAPDDDSRAGPDDAEDALVAAHVVALAAGEAAARFVVGLPVEKDGSEGWQSRRTRRFAVALANAVARELLGDGGAGGAGGAAPARGGVAADGGRVYLWDERYSSKHARALLTDQGVGSQPPLAGGGAPLPGDPRVDPLAACAILDHFFAAPGGVSARAELVPPSDDALLALAARRRAERRDARARASEAAARPAPPAAPAVAPSEVMAASRTRRYVESRDEE